LTTSVELPHWISSPDPEVFLSDNFVTLDFETTNIKKGDALEQENRLLLWATKAGNSPVSAEWGNEYEVQSIFAMLQEADFLVAQNAKFELQWLQRAGLDISQILFADTMVAEYVLLGNRKAPLDLGSIAARYGLPGKEPYVDKCLKAGICLSTLPKSLVEERCRYDVEVTSRVWQKQRALLSEKGLLPCFFTRSIFTPVLADIESNGLCLDKERVYEEYTKEAKRFEELDKRMSEFTGGINPRSPKQMAEFIYETLGFDELARGNLVQWNPHVFSGTPFFGSIQPALLYPPNLVYLVLPLPKAINVDLFGGSRETDLSFTFLNFNRIVYRLRADLRVIPKRPSKTLAPGLNGAQIRYIMAFTINMGPFFAAQRQNVNKTARPEAHFRCECDRNVSFSRRRDGIGKNAAFSA